MALHKGDNIAQASNRGISYYVGKVIDGTYNIHAQRATTDNNDLRYARTSVEAQDNARLIFDMLMDPEIAEYYVDGGGLVAAFLQGSPAAAFDYNFGGGSSTIPTIGGGANCTAGTKQTGNGSYYTAICAILGYIEVLSGYNPYHSIYHYTEFDGIATNIDMGYTTPPASYGAVGFSSAAVRRRRASEGFIPAISPYTAYNKPAADFPLQYQPSSGSYTPWHLYLTPAIRQQEMEYGILGLTCPSSVNGYSYGINLCTGGVKTKTGGDAITLLEQVWSDIMGMPYLVNDGISDIKTPSRGLATPWGDGADAPYGYFPFTAAPGYYEDWEGTLNYTRLFEQDWQYWNGTYTGRSFIRNLDDLADLGAGTGEKWGGIDAIPPFTTPTSYSSLPWACTVTDGDTDGAILDLINSIQTWRKSYYWTQARITQAQDAARYWYSYFIAEHTTATPAGTQEEWKWPIFQSAYLY